MLQQCRQCHAWFDPEATLGLWPCWRHPGRLEGNVWTCCGLPAGVPWTRVCTPTDHRAAVADAVDADDDNDDDDLWVVTSRPPPAGPGRDAGWTLVSNDDAAMADLAAQGLRAAADAAIAAAYARPDYWASLPPTLRVRARAAAEHQAQRRLVWRPPRRDEVEEAHAHEDTPAAPVTLWVVRRGAAAPSVRLVPDQ